MLLTDSAGETLYFAAYDLPVDKIHLITRDGDEEVTTIMFKNAKDFSPIAITLSEDSHAELCNFAQTTMDTFINTGAIAKYLPTPCPEHSQQSKESPPSRALKVPTK